MPPKYPSDIETTIAGWPEAAKTCFHALRKVIFQTAASNSAVGTLEEVLKWGEPSFLTSQTRSGTTLRISWKPKTPDEIGVFVICRTDMLKQVRALYPEAFRYEGTRAAYLPLSHPIPEEAVAYLAMRAQTYHLETR
ncbi:hypothetical protein SAMN05444000_111116 [Shimia gijangensis]|uniref:YdhG-like domain-containing protein n=1 Tax=Shimia gijangensis TaxID=1470563 RepID=A0A1M6L8Q4_9RHOB|nr:hypothetical protein [Shimia gijangensis]SHJ67586.1 hypothetical protein SAMN05444000_111116 [Shimia gijangensis]